MSLALVESSESIPVDRYDRYIVLTPSVRAGRPRITGRRITVADVALWHIQQGISVDEIVAEYDLTHAQVYAALTYYFDHKSEVDKQSAEDSIQAESLRTQFPSKLQAKLSDRG